MRSAAATRAAGRDGVEATTLREPVRGAVDEGEEVALAERLGVGADRRRRRVSPSLAPGLVPADTRLVTELRFYYDIVCPYAYLASTRIEALAAERGATVSWRPILLGGLFRSVGAPQQPATAMSAPRARMNLLDLQRYADRWAVPLDMPAAHPRRTVAAMRLLIAAEGPARIALTHALYRAYWAEGRDLADRAIVDAIAREHGVDPAVIDGDAARDGLFAATAEAAELGAFGVPAMAIGDRFWWGQDRLHLVDAALGGAPIRPGERPPNRPGEPPPNRLGEPPPNRLGERPPNRPGERPPNRPGEPLPNRPGERPPNRPGEPPPNRPGEPPPINAPSGATIDFFHDFSSPFSYLAATQIARIAAAYGATLRWRPILLGALFRELGTPDVPLLAMNEAKQRYMGRDLDDWAAYWGVPFRFPTHFPIRTVVPLRAALARPSLTLPLYRAAWADDRTIDDPEVLAAIARECGEDPEGLVDAVSSAEIKARLRDNTDAAREAGCCGVPSMLVTPADGGAPILFWGQDRLEMMTWALEGWRPPRG